MKRVTTKLIILGLISIALPLAAATGASAQASPQRPDATYEVTYTNLTTGQYLTPPNFVAHGADIDVFELGQAASSSLQAVAENGAVPVLAAELEAAVAGSGISGVGAEEPIGPGESVTFDFSTNARRFSLVSMVICTNDGFAGLDARLLPSANGQTKTFRLRAYDAGTERNTELRADLVPAPFCGEGDGSGETDPALAQNGVIRRHPTLRGHGDLDPALDWTGRVAEVSIRKVPTVGDYTVTVENLTTGQYLTPPNFAAHDRRVDIFSRGEAASPELQAVAENGGVPVLAAALEQAVDGAGLGVSGVGADGPIGPGASVTFDVSTTANRLSLVSMLICTNDGFAGLDSRRLPRYINQSKTFYLKAYDAGTEINTELRADLVPAPFCGEGEGSEVSDAELAENGVIRRHRSLQGVGDIDPALDWRGPVVMVTVTRN